MAVTDCRYFSGYKPCGRSASCDSSCPSLDRPQLRLLIIHLGAMGAVVRATSLLAAIKRKYPSSHITWVTEAPMHLLLQGNLRIDRVLTTSASDQLALRALEFDFAFVLDKSLVASGILALTQADVVLGFQADPRTGAILPANRGAQELWELGLDDHRKFFVNQKPETQLQVEALELGPFRRDEYDLHLTTQEKFQAESRKLEWTLDSNQPVIAFNTGCGPLMPAKKWTVEFHRRVINSLLEQGFRNLVLLGGPEDTGRNLQIAQDLPVILSPTQSGVRDGLISTVAADLVFTGDSFGMHLGIAMKRFVVAWFGPSCAQEIDLYDRGVKLQTTLGCSPCWKRHCSQTQMCYDHVEPSEIQSALLQGLTWWNETTPEIQSPQP